MTDLRKEDIDELTAAMAEGFKLIHEELDTIKTTQYKHGEIFDHMAGRLDALWTENAAQTIHNRRVDVRISRLEEHLGIAPTDEILIAA